jgi:hypothetical protein
MGLAKIDASKPSAYSWKVMRFFLAGLLILALPAAALAQARGQVLSLGFNNRYRADCWTPMLVQLTSQSADSQDYQIQIVQEDLDRDRVTYTQTVTLGGNVEGRPATTENFWVYFKPKPVDGGLPDATDMTTTLATLNSELKIFLCDKDGKQLSTLPLTSTIMNVDPKHPLGDGARGSRLILFVSDGADQPEISDYAQQKGVLQDVEAGSVAPRDLPGNVIGYEAVDAIVWMDADANFLTSGTHTPSLEALLQWVHQGGHLVVCQPGEAIKLKPFEQILPVGEQINGQWTIPTVDRKGVDVLDRLAHPGGDTIAPAWPGDLGTFKVARVPALPGSKVDEWLTWTDGGRKSFTPWLARRSVGLGAVTWVAQDLGNAALTRRAKSGWRYVWDRVFDWNDPPNVAEDYKAVDGQFDAWPGTDKAVDLGAELSQHGMDLPSTAAVLLAIAGFFFVVYWLVAGPGIYLVLVARKQANLSWFVFALTAIAATALTALLVKAVVRGPPKLQHLSVVRYAAGEPTGVIDSRFGLYIREDGAKTIGLQETAAHEVSYVTPFSMNPQYVSDSEELPAYLEYQIPVPEESDSGSVSVTIPFRSTLKKLQAHWVGEMKGTIDPSPDTPVVKLDADNKLVGTLVNHTGYDLNHVFLGFKRPRGVIGDVSSQDSDILVYVDQWAKNDSLKLDDLISKKTSMNLEIEDKTHHPMESDTVYGDMGLVTDTAGSWGRFWRSKGDELGTDLDYSLPMLTFFDRLPPWAEQKGEHADRYELRRYGARALDLSPALSAGSMVICARAMVNKETDQTPLPESVTVSDTPIEGQGTTFFEFVLPVDRTAVSGEPATMPSGQ